MRRRIAGAVAALAAAGAIGAVWLVSGSLAAPIPALLPDPDMGPLVEAGYATKDESGSYVFDRQFIDGELELLTPSDGTLPGPYDRDHFGQRWADEDRNGCDTRNDILRVWLTDVTIKPGTQGCVVLSGTLSDPFSGDVISFTRGQGTSEAVQIDHLWPLSAAWQRGADTWTHEKRQQFANDPLNLTPVDGPLNQSKSDSGPEWMPPNVAYRCTYAARMILVASTYQLELTVSDRSALEVELRSCS